MQWELLYGGPGYFRISVFDDFRIYSSGVDPSIHKSKYGMSLLMFVQKPGYTYLSA